MDPAQLVTPNTALPAPIAPPTAAPPVPAPEEKTETAPPATLPDALLKLPAFQGLLVGKPGAVSADLKSTKDRDEAKLFSKNKDALLAGGFIFYRSLDGNTGVLANGMYVHPEELKQADAAGQLLQLAPDFDSVNHGLGKAGAAHPALNPNHVPPTGLKSAPPVSVPQMQAAPMPEPPASAQRKVMAARIANLQPGSPTSGGSPGAGRLLNSVLKPVL
jgi:hypothetical protein